MPKVELKDDGQPLRTAIEQAGFSIPDLAGATTRVDPDGRGVSPATIGRLVSRGKSSRQRCELKTAWFVAEALHRVVNAPLQDLFAMPPRSTATVERSSPDAEEV